MSIETEVSSFSFKIQISAPWVTDGVLRGGGWVIHPQRWRSIPVQLHSPKALCKNTWLIARVKNSRHFPYTIHKNNKWKAGSLVQGKMFLFLEAAEKKGRESWQGKLTKQGWHLPCEPEQAEGNISLHLGEISVLCLSATKRQHVYPSERRLAQYQPNTIIWRNLDLSAEERETLESKQRWQLCAELLKKYSQTSFPLSFQKENRIDVLKEECKG